MFVRTAVALAACLAFSSGCFIPRSSMRDVEDERAHGGGTARVVDLAAPQAYTCAATALRWEGADRLEEHPDRLNVLSDLKTMGSTMTYAGAWIEPQGESHAKVTVVTKRASMTLNTNLTEGTFLDDVQRCAAITKAGQPIPAEKP